MSNNQYQNLNEYFANGQNQIALTQSSNPSVIQDEFEENNQESNQGFFPNIGNQKISEITMKK